MNSMIITTSGLRVATAFALLGLCVSPIGQTPARAAPVLNGSFETPLVPLNLYTVHPAGSSALTNWTVFGSAGEAVAVGSTGFSQNGVAFPAQTGAQWLDLTGLNHNSPAGVSQTVSTVIGHLYELSYWIGNTTGGDIFGTASTVDVLLNGTLAFSDTNATISPATLSWSPYVHRFVAITSTITLSFRNADPLLDNSNALDNIVLDDLGLPGGTVPEPATLGLCLIALAGLHARFSRGKPATSAGRPIGAAAIE